MSSSPTTNTTKVVLEPSVVADFLRQRFLHVDDVELLKGGAWSAAYRFVGDDQQLVVKFGQNLDDYQRDALAGTWSLPKAPTLPVLEIGSALDGCFAILPWAQGEAFDELPPSRFVAAQASVMQAYEALSTIDLPGTGFGILAGTSPDAPFATWADHLLSKPQRDDERLRGWREKLGALPEARAAFERGQRVLERLVPNCPNERRVLHCDPMWSNLLIGPDDSLVAMLDWGIAMAGDPMYDLAMLLYCAPWWPSIDTDAVRYEAVRRSGTRDVEEHMRAYQIEIGLGSLQYTAFSGLTEFIEPTVQLINSLCAS